MGGARKRKQRAQESLQLGEAPTHSSEGTYIHVNIAPKQPELLVEVCEIFVRTSSVDDL